MDECGLALDGREAFRFAAVDGHQRIGAAPPGVGQSDYLGHLYEPFEREGVDVGSSDPRDRLRPEARLVGQGNRLHPAFDARVEGNPAVTVDPELTGWADHEPVG